MSLRSSSNMVFGLHHFSYEPHQSVTRSLVRCMCALTLTAFTAETCRSQAFHWLYTVLYRTQPALSWYQEQI